MDANKAIENMRLVAFSLSMSGHHDHANMVLEALPPLERVVAAITQAVNKACTCIKPGYFPRRVNDQCLECGGSISLATKA